jgi:hypothetical protein
MQTRTVNRTSSQERICCYFDEVAVQKHVSKIP